MSTFLESQNWRYATKKFDNTKKISNDDLETLKEAVRLSASSFGLQLYKVFIVENPEVRAKLIAASWGQTQIVDASQIFVFASYTKVDDKDVDLYVENIAATREIALESISGYGDFMKSNIKTRSSEDLNIWTAKQTYIALGNLLAVAAELKIDATPMEGFDPKQYNEILGLDAQNLTAAVICPVGYRSAEDTTRHYKKVRKSKEDLFTKI